MQKKWWLRIIEFFHKIFVKKPKIVYLGEKIPSASIILCNHVSSSGPTVWELYMDNFHFWATHEMTEGTASLYRYLSQIYFPQKKHWNKTLAKIFCFFVSPLAAIYVSGWRLIPTYRDSRFSKTVKSTIEVLKNNCSVLIFPENSSEGYHDELVSVHPGFCLAGDAALKNGININIVMAYLGKGKGRSLIIDRPVSFSELKERFGSKNAIADYVCSRINELSRY